VYNAAPDWGVGVGEGVAVPEPRLCSHEHRHGGQTYSFTGIRLPSPLALLVNGRRPPSSAHCPP
ncbi:TTC5 protein, partial [Podargus strigoides]|nr:TTC5 protein [Podargus strigoides]